MNNIAEEATWRRALRDSESFRHSGKFFWGFEVFGAAAFAAIVTYFFLPDDPSRFESAVYPLSGVVAGFVAAYSLIYLWNLFRAPYRQRNEARAALRALGASPTSPILATPELFIESSECQFGEPGKRGYPQSETGAARSLRVDIYLNTTNGMQVESIELEVQGKRIPSTWKSYAVYGTPFGGYIYIEVPPEVTSGLHQVRLVALADGKSWMSQPFSVTFP